jgi:hypothetical protein
MMSFRVWKADLFKGKAFYCGWTKATWKETGTAVPEIVTPTS